MKERILQFLKEKNITSTKFADMIGVQRSSISHILSGRNKPSFDFIEKMLIAYPDVDAQWLITGKQSEKIDTINKIIEPNLFSQQDTLTKNLTTSQLNINDENKELTVKNNYQRDLNGIHKTNSLDNEIEKIVIFYNNNTFKEYKPK